MEGRSTDQGRSKRSLSHAYWLSETLCFGCSSRHAVHLSAQYVKSKVSFESLSFPNLTHTHCYVRRKHQNQTQRCD